MHSCSSGVLGFSRYFLALLCSILLLLPSNWVFTGQLLSSTLAFLCISERLCLLHHDGLASGLCWPEIYIKHHYKYKFWIAHNNVKCIKTNYENKWGMGKNIIKLETRPDEKHFLVPGYQNVKVGCPGKSLAAQQKVEDKYCNKCICLL